MSRQQRNSWTEAEDAILIEHWNALDARDALCGALGGRAYEAIKSRIRYLRSCGIKLVTRRGDPVAERRRKQAAAAAAHKRREQRLYEAQIASEIIAAAVHGAIPQIPWPEPGRILFTDDPRALADRGSMGRLTQPEPMCSTTSSSAAWAV